MRDKPTYKIRKAESRTDDWKHINKNELYSLFRQNVHYPLLDSSAIRTVTAVGSDNQMYFIKRLDGDIRGVKK